MYVNVYSTDHNHSQRFLRIYATVNIVPEIKRIRDVGAVAVLGTAGYAMRIRLNSDRMQANNVSSDDVLKAITPSGMIGRDDRLETAMRKVLKPKEDELIFIGHSDKPERYENIILKASDEGEILRLKEVGQVELVSTPFDISSDVDGHPAAAVVLKRAPGSNDAEVIAAVKEKLTEIKETSFPQGMAFEVIPFDSRDMIYAAVETPQGSALELTTARCQELGAIARGLDGVASVSSLGGYQVRAESGGSNVGTCLIQLKDRPSRKPTSRQIIEALEKKCRTMKVHPEFFEPPAVSTFVAAGGFSVRVLDKANSNGGERPGRVPETPMDALLDRRDLAGLFDFLASNYPQHELVIDSDAARRKGVSIASAIENLAKVVGGDGQAERKLQTLVEELSNSSVKNNRREMVPYSSFMQLKNKLRPDESDRQE